VRAIIVIHNTTLGPALGGIRMWPYESERDAIVDCMRLARGMTFKAAVAGLNLGGGKTVVIGDPRKDKSEALFRALGRFVDTLRRALHRCRGRWHGDRGHGLCSHGNSIRHRHRSLRWRLRRPVADDCTRRVPTAFAQQPRRSTAPTSSKAGAFPCRVAAMLAATWLSILLMLARS